MTPLDPDRILALSYVPARRRPAVEALWRLDLALGQALAGGREPLISQIKLAWWREALEKLDSAPAPSEPVLQAVAAHVLPAGVSGTELAAMEEGWAVLLSPERLSAADLQTYAARRGGLLFRHSAALLGGGEPAAGAGEAWALIDLARHSAEEADVEAAVAAARGRARARRWPARLRPLGMLAALARRDAEAGRPRWEAQGAPGRMLRMLRHRLTGF
ncbi:MAG: squalene/phytoene synthase family protein [Allosphingosinicella sp.]